MTTPSTVFDTYIPVYDAIPKDWEESRQFLVERLKEMSNGINIREVGYYLDQEILAGKNFVPGTANPPQFRQVFRRVIDFSPIVIGPNLRPHGITFDNNFTLVLLNATATDSVGQMAIPIPNGPNTITMGVNTVTIVSAAAYNRCFATVEYMLEL
jgi:hypothetical protein